MKKNNRLLIITIIIGSIVLIIALAFIFIRNHGSEPEPANAIGQDGDTEFRVKSFECGFESIEVESQQRGYFQPLPAQNGQFCILDFQATQLVLPTVSESIFSYDPIAIGADRQTIYPALEVGLNDPHPDGYCRHQLHHNNPRDCKAYFDVPTDATITQILFRNSRNSILKTGGVLIDLPK